MQKISSYLYSNKIIVVEDVASFPVEFKMNYQRTIKFYKGILNILEFDVRNADQKRININNYNLRCVIMDQNDKEIKTYTVNPIAGSPGLAELRVEPGDIEYLKPQFLKYTLYRVDENGNKILFYVDSYFGAKGSIDLLDSVLPKTATPEIIDTFIYTENDVNPNDIVRTYTSDAVEINPKNDINDQHSLTLEFRNQGLSATVVVQITDDVVVHTATTWKDLETFNISNTTENLIKIYNEIEDYSNNVNWLRIKYEPIDNSAGKFDKILVIS